MREIDETVAYIIEEECRAALARQITIARCRMLLAEMDLRPADAAIHRTVLADLEAELKRFVGSAG